VLSTRRRAVDTTPRQHHETLPLHVTAHRSSGGTSSDDRLCVGGGANAEKSRPLTTRNSFSLNFAVRSASTLLIIEMSDVVL